MISAGLIKILSQLL
ncbi:MAG: hypothetical protein KDJ65_28725, partial [Anaerolineae bacterium]|nr:hypothetical protein [Anaerolineae bacterium]